MKLWKLVPVALLIAGVASAQNPTPPAAPKPPTAPDSANVDPAGAYDFTTVANGENVSGTLYIAASPDKPDTYIGKIVTNIFPEIPVTGAKVKGNAIDVTGAMPDGELALHFVLDADGTFKGNWTLGADSGEFNGKKQPKQ